MIYFGKWGVISKIILDIKILYIEVGLMVPMTFVKGLKDIKHSILKNINRLIHFYFLKIKQISPLCYKNLGTFTHLIGSFMSDFSKHSSNMLLILYMVFFAYNYRKNNIFVYEIV